MDRASFPCVRYRFPCDLENYIVDRASFLCVLYRFPRCWKNSTTDRTNFLCLRRFGHLNLGRSSSEENFCWKNIDMRFRSFSHISIWKACLEFQDYSRTFLRRRAEIDSSFFHLLLAQERQTSDRFYCIVVGLVVSIWASPWFFPGRLGSS